MIEIKSELQVLWIDLLYINCCLLYRGKLQERDTSDFKSLKYYRVKWEELLPTIRNYFCRVFVRVFFN
jgi:hypothetical protein